MKKSFGTGDETAIIEDILRNGQIQISEKERLAYYENVWLEVSNLVSEKCVNPANNRRYTPETIRQALKMAEFSPHPTRTAKQQFLDCVKLLMKKQVLPIQRAKMCLRMTFDNSLNEVVASLLNEVQAEVILRHETNIELLLDPSHYRVLEKFCNEQVSEPRLEVVNLTVIEEGDAGLEIDLARRTLLSDQNQLAVGSVEENKGQDENEEMSEDSVGLSDELAQKAKIYEQQSDDEYGNPIQNLRKSAKKAQKKSKKAKRREKEEEAERVARREKEALRQAERAARRKEEGNIFDANDRSENTKNVGDSESLSTCNTCGGSFTKTQYRSHFKSDWHRYNIKLKMQGATCIGEEEFKLADIDFF